MLSVSRVFCTVCRKGNNLAVVPSCSYKSKYSLDNLYPHSSGVTSRESLLKQIADDKFTGYIPVEELTVRYSRSSGPGGQNVNKVNTKVEMRFHVESARWIPDWIKPKLMQQEKSRMTRDGYLIVSSDKTRKQLLNCADCMTRVRAMIWQAAKQIEINTPTEEDLETVRQRQEQAAKNMLKEKRAHSLKKKMRQKPSMETV